MLKINQAIFTKIFLKTCILSIVIVCNTLTEQAPLATTELPKFTAAELVQKAIKKSFAQGYQIDRTPVESSIYLQQIITNYNSHVKHSISTLLKKEVDQGFSHAKELSYLLGQLNSTITTKQAIVILTRAVSAHKAMMQENAVHQKKIDWYENAYSPILLQSSVILLNAAREQFLVILDEINSSLLYWKEQKNHPMKYFFHKSPLKWVTGQRQTDEVVGNIKKLEKLEHDIRVLLGRITKHIYAFKPDGNVDECYTWINQLLSMLYCIGVDSKKIEYENRFDETADKVRFKLGRVSSLKNILLSKISPAIKPGHIARNWLTYSAALAAAYVARNYYVKNTEVVNKIIGPEALAGYAVQVQKYTQENVITPVLDTVKAIFVRQGSLPKKESAIKVSREELEKALTELTIVQKTWLGAEYGYVNAHPLPEDRKNEILAEDLRGNTAPLLKLWFHINKNPRALISTIEPAIHVIASYLLLQGAYAAEELRVVKNLVILSPGLILAGVGFAGLNKLYQSAVSRDYTIIRLAMLDINSLFIEALAPLSDHDYGKLLYLLQDLKSEAIRYLTVADMRNDFLTDLAKLESHKFTVETKRRIIKNMFMKYPFLSLSAKST